MTLTARVAASLDKTDAQVMLDADALRALVRLCGASEFFGDMLASNPLLIPALVEDAQTDLAERDYRALLRSQIDREQSFAAELSTLRRTWTRLLLEIGTRDVAGTLPLAASNRLQTELAVASIDAAYLIARRELARRFGKLDADPRLAVLGLGRLGSGGMDYGSDLDIVLVYDTGVPSPVAALARAEAYARLGELLTAALSSITREGHLYRVDLRLRPDGQKGPLVRGAQSFVDYLGTRAGIWEWLAYVKLRAVGGDLEFGRSAERAARRTIHDAAQGCDPDVLRVETRRVRERLERERASATRGGLDIKFGAGGMLDVYFAARYLQLRANVPDEDADRSTAATLARLHANGALTQQICTRCTTATRICARSIITCALSPVAASTCPPRPITLCSQTSRVRPTTTPSANCSTQRKRTCAPSAPPTTASRPNRRSRLLRFVRRFIPATHAPTSARRAFVNCLIGGRRQTTHDLAFCVGQLTPRAQTGRAATRTCILACFVHLLSIFQTVRLWLCGSLQLMRALRFENATRAR